jgi:hypothetical protein
METKQETTREIVATMLKILWRGIPSEYKSRYRMTIWEQFQNQIVAAAYTSSIARFVNSICSRMGISVGRNEAERGAFEAIIQSIDERKALKMLREETEILVLMVRIDNEEQREQARKEMEGNA